MSNLDLPCNRAREIALAVHRLVAQPDNLREFRRQFERFISESAKPQQAWKEKIGQVEETPWPGPSPSTATKFTLLAVLHDFCLQYTEKILDPVIADGKDGSEGAWALQMAHLWCTKAAKRCFQRHVRAFPLPPTEDGDPKRLDALEGFLEEIKVAQAAEPIQQPRPLKAYPAVRAADDTRQPPVAGGPGAVAGPTPDSLSKEARVAPCPVVLGGADDPPTVCGEEKEPLGLTAYNVVKALVEAYPKGLVKAHLERKADCADPHKVLARLREKDADWEAVIFMPGKAGRGGYRLKPV